MTDWVATLTEPLTLDDVLAAPGYRRLSQEVVEVLSAATGTSLQRRLTQIVAEVLSEATGTDLQRRLTQIVVEVLSGRYYIDESISLTDALRVGFILAAATDNPLNLSDVVLSFIASKFQGVFMIEADWDNDGAFEGGDEDLTVDIQQGSWRRGRDAELARAIPGSLELVLKNDDGKYSPDNSGSPLSGDLLPGRKIRIRTESPDKTHFVGFIEDIIPNPDPDEKTCYVRAIDASAQILATKQLRTPMFAQYASGQAIGDLLDRVDWPVGERAIDAGQTTMDRWWAHDEPTLENIGKVEEAELGLFYIAGNGYATFEDRHHRLKGDHLTAQSTITATMIAMDYQSRLREIKNEVTIKVYPVVEGSPGTELWRLREFPFLAPQTRDILVIGAGATINVTAVFYAEYDDPSTLITPVASTDYTFNTTADGLGDDLTSQLTVTIESTFAMGAAVSITNNGPLPGFLSLLKLRGTAFVRPDAVSMSAGDVASQAANGRRTHAIDNEFMQNALEAQDFADYILGRKLAPQAYLLVEFANVSAAMQTIMLTRDISDRVRITEPNTGVDDDYFIERLEFDLEGTEIICRWLCSKADTRTFWTLDHATLGKLDAGNRLAA